MSPSEPAGSTDNHTPSLTTGSRLGRLAGIGVVLLGVAGAFLYLGGWFTPHALTPARFVDAFQRVAGIHSGFRRNHAKGVCVSGFFESNGQGTRLSKAVVFRTGRTSVIGRFSFGGGNPYVADAPDMVRGLGLLFWLSDGEEWRTAMINLPVFPVKTPQAFFDNLVAGQPDPQTHKPDPLSVVRFREQHIQRSQCLPLCGCRRRIDSRALVDGACTAVCSREYDGDRSRRQ
jgi:catalase